MSLTIAELSPKFMRSKEISHATPARSDHTGVGPVCATLFGSGLAPCPTVAPGSDSGLWAPHGLRGFAGDGPGRRTTLYELSSGPEPRHLVDPARESDSVGIAHYGAGASGGDDCARGRRHSGTPFGAEDHSQR